MTYPTRDIDCARTQAATYRIRVAEVLGEEWSGRAQGMAISVHRSESARSFTELLGELPDEAALMGLLDALYAHGARLLSVEQVEPHPTNDREVRKGNL